MGGNSRLSYNFSLPVQLQLSLMRSLTVRVPWLSTFPFKAPQWRKLKLPKQWWMDIINVHLFTFSSAIWENEGSTAKRVNVRTFALQLPRGTVWSSQHQETWWTATGSFIQPADLPLIIQLYGKAQLERRFADILIFIVSFLMCPSIQTFLNSLFFPY